MSKRNPKTNQWNPSETKLVMAAIRKSPDVPTRTLAKRLVKMFPDRWTLEMARGRIRYWRGANGKQSRKQAVNVAPELVKSWDEAKVVLATVPPPEKTDVIWTPYNIPGEKVLSISDIHYPFHDEDALEIALRTGYENKVDSILINGDLIDFYQISRFTKTMKGRKIELELRGTYQLIQAIRKIFGPSIPITWKMGNHEERWADHMSNVSSALWETQLSQVDKIFKCPELFFPEDEAPEYDLDIKFVKSQPMKIGHLWVLHGHEVGKGIFSPVNQARGVFLRTLNCTLVGHGHQTSSHSNKSINDKVIACWSQGCLCDLHPRYNMVSLRWNHGFAIVERTDLKGNFQILNYKIIDDRAYVS